MTGGAVVPQQRLYLMPDPQGQGALRGVLVFAAGAAGGDLQNELCSGGVGSGSSQNELP